MTKRDLLERLREASEGVDLADALSGTAIQVYLIRSLGLVIIVLNAVVRAVIKDNPHGV